MLIYIDNSIATYAASNTIDEETIYMFSELAVAHQRGNCFLCGNDGSLKFLAGIIGGTAGKIYSHINQHQAEVRSIIDVLSTLIVLSYNDTPSVPGFIQGKYRLVKIQDAVKCKISSPCTFIGENLHDCDFYEVIGKKYYLSNSIKGTHLAFHRELGGGGTMYSVFQKCVTDDKAITLCIADSDVKYAETKTYPNPPGLGETCKKVKKTYDNLQSTQCSPLFFFYILPVHELENLIPTSLLEAVVKNSCADAQNGLAFILKLKQANLSDAILHYDFKEGKKSYYDEKKVDEKHIAARCYWDEISEAIADSSLPPFCKNILELSLIQINVNGTSASQIKDLVVDDYLLSHWNEVGRLIFSWGCAHAPMRA